MGYNKQAWTPDTRLQADTISLSCYLKDVYTKLGILSLEQALIDNLQKFLLELGKGFCLKRGKNVLPLMKNLSLLI